MYGVQFHGNTEPYHTASQELWEEVTDNFSKMIRQSEDIVRFADEFTSENPEQLTEIITRAKTSDFYSPEAKESIQTIEKITSDLKRELIELEPLLKKGISLEKTVKLEKLIADYQGVETEFELTQQRYNENALLLNQKIAKFPNSILALVFGYKSVAVFQ